MYRLFTDESGKNLLRTVDSQHPFYCVAGALIHETSNQFIQRRADQIKFKYWGRTDVTLHAVDLRHLKDEFSIFRGKPDLLNEFHEDFKTLMVKGNFKVIWVCVDKQSHIKNNPPIAYAISKGFIKDTKAHERRLNEKIFAELWQIYLCYLVTSKNSSGTVVVEASDKNQDGDILSSYNKVMSGGVPALNLSVSDVRMRLTSLSFVTKRNWDVGTELADFASYFLTLDHRITSGLKITGVTNFDNDVIQILKSKTFRKRCNGLNKNSCQIL